MQTIDFFKPSYFRIAANLQSPDKILRFVGLTGAGAKLTDEAKKDFDLEETARLVNATLVLCDDPDDVVAATAVNVIGDLIMDPSGPLDTADKSYHIAQIIYRIHSPQPKTQIAATQTIVSLLTAENLTSTNETRFGMTQAVMPILKAGTTDVTEKFVESVGCVMAELAYSANQAIGQTLYNNMHGLIQDTRNSTQAKDSTARKTAQTILNVAAFMYNMADAAGHPVKPDQLPPDQRSRLKGVLQNGLA